MKKNKMKYKPFYKKVDKSLLNWGFTIPKEWMDDFQSCYKLNNRSSKRIDIQWGNKKKTYIGDLRQGKTRGQKYYQVRYVNNRELLKKIRKTFIQSYVILKSKKEDHDKKEMKKLLNEGQEEKKYFRSKMEAGQQEVLIVHFINSNLVKINPYIKIETEWNELFQRLADENVFGWLYEKKSKHLFSSSTNWLNKNKFNEHLSKTGIIYYLAHTKKKWIYIGMTKGSLRKRIKIGQSHMGMAADWDKFRYDIIKPEFIDFIENIEGHTIRAYASILKNKIACPSLKLSSYTLVNKRQ